MSSEENKKDSDGLADLEGFIRRIPGIRPQVGKGRFEDGNWWIKFTIDISHPLAWNVVQELGHILNYLSIRERLPTVFKPVSPPSYLNGGPREFLSWVIESTTTEFGPLKCIEWLEGRLPRPVDDQSKWFLGQDESNWDEHSI